MHHTRTLRFIEVIAWTVLTAAVMAQAAAGQSIVFVHQATASNTFLHVTQIDHPFLNNNPTANPIITQNWDPLGGLSGVTNANEIGVSYSTSSGRWSIYNENIAAMPIGAAFNVMTPDQGADAFVHTSTPTSIVGNATFLGYPTTALQPDLVLLVTHNKNPGGGNGPDNNHSNSVLYSTFADNWTITNQDMANMGVDVSFNVLSPPAGSNLFKHTVTLSNSSFNLSRIDHPLANGHPTARIFVTQNTTPAAALNDHPIGVIFDLFEDKWAVFNEDDADLPLGAVFNIFVSPAIFADGFESGDTSRW